MKGKLFGVGVGPGDPELLTLKALKCLQNCDVVVIPDAEKGKSTAYNIAVQAYPELVNKPSITVTMPMTHDLQRLGLSYRTTADLVEEKLNEGLNLAFITLGDPTVYATYMYVHQLVDADGYPVEIISGIPSFCAAAARMNISLAERAEMLHIVPSSHGVETALTYPGVKVLMKAGSKMKNVRQQLIESGMNIWMVENCGMETERVYYRAEDIPEDAGYFSLIIAKDRGIEK